MGIQEYDRAWKSSRELVRKRQEKTEGKGRKGRVWQIGEACRAMYSEDGEEYEGTVVHRNTANRSVTVRFHGYNNEEEIKERELMESLGQEVVDEQSGVRMGRFMRALLRALTGKVELLGSSFLDLVMWRKSRLKSCFCQRGRRGEESRRALGRKWGMNRGSKRRSCTT